MDQTIKLPEAWAKHRFLPSKYLSNHDRFHAGALYFTVTQICPSNSSLSYYLSSPVLCATVCIEGLTLCCERKSKQKKEQKKRDTCNAGKLRSNKWSSVDYVQARARQFDSSTFYYWRYDAWWCSHPTIESSYGFTVVAITQSSGDMA